MCRVVALSSSALAESRRWQSTAAAAVVGTLTADLAELTTRLLEFTHQLVELGLVFHHLGIVLELCVDLGDLDISTERRHCQFPAFGSRFRGSTGQSRRRCRRGAGGGARQVRLLLPLVHDGHNGHVGRKGESLGAKVAVAMIVVGMSGMTTTAGEHGMKEVVVFFLGETGKGGYLRDQIGLASHRCVGR